MKQLDELQQHYQNLSQRDQNLAIIMSVILAVTLFYIIIWEPLHLNLEKQKNTQTSQLEIHHWMQNAAAEVRALKASGNRGTRIQKKHSPVSIVAEQSAKLNGLSKQIGKIESSGKNSAQIKVENASFNQMLLWINTLKTRYGISVSSAKIEHTNKAGIINARLILNRS